MTDKNPAPKRRRKPTKEELAAIEPDPAPVNDRTLDNRFGSSEGLKRAEIFHLHQEGDNQRYHEIINNPDRYMVLEHEATWNKDKGMVIGRSMFVLYVDRFAKH